MKSRRKLPKESLSNCLSVLIELENVDEIISHRKPSELESFFYPFCNLTRGMGKLSDKFRSNGFAFHFSRYFQPDWEFQLFFWLNFQNWIRNISDPFHCSKEFFIITDATADFFLFRYLKWAICKLGLMLWICLLKCIFTACLRVWFTL